uniref:Uncharacterized protein n=1 Tax=Arundo donax TaxID=35708 RepID=A0A0A8ZGY8_ARUDO
MLNSFCLLVHFTLFLVPRFFEMDNTNLISV